MKYKASSPPKTIMTAEVLLCDKITNDKARIARLKEAKRKSCSAVKPRHFRLEGR